MILNSLRGNFRRVSLNSDRHVVIAVARQKKINFEISVNIIDAKRSKFVQYCI